MPLWDFRPREVYKNFKGAVTLNRFSGIDTLYQARHGGASRDTILRRRSQLEVQNRLHHASQSSTRIYNQPGKIQQMLNTLDRSDLQYAGHVCQNFVSFAQSGKFPRPPRVPSGAKLS